MNSALKPQITQEKSIQQRHKSAASAALSTPASLASRYKIIRQIGQGSQAKVYLAKRLSDRAIVTIKQLDIESVSNWKEYDLFHRESAVLSHLNIDGVARFYESLECLDDKPPCSYIVQEYIDGISLAEMLKSGRRLSTNEVYDILIQLLNILYHLQNRKNPIIHRDIKPSNIMLTPKADGYHVTLIDFGAVANPQVQSGGSTVAGTFGYMPPEQLMGKPQPASDIYAVAAVAVELFSGKSPAILPNKDFRLIFEPKLENQPPELVNTLRRMLEPDANSRFCDIPKLCAIFNNYKAGKFTDIDAALPEIDKFNHKLTEVKELCEPGNIQLWQMLPDIGPRVLPDSYKLSAIAENMNGCLTGFCFAFFCIIMYLAVIPGIISLIIIGEVWLFSQFKLPTLLYVLAVVLFIPQILFLSRLIRTIFKRVAPHLMDAVFADSHDEKKSEAARQIARKLVESGRKTIATITDITYKPQTDCTKKKGLIIASSLPCFEVQYKFNPPDDAREEDLIHKCIVHTDGKDQFKPGDPLPILYQINRDESTGETVTSMPFPFPLADAKPEEIVDSSNDSAESELTQSQGQIQ